jgi:hypothetical protein
MFRREVPVKLLSKKSARFSEVALFSLAIQSLPFRGSVELWTEAVMLQKLNYFHQSAFMARLCADAAD